MIASWSSGGPPSIVAFLPTITRAMRPNRGSSDLSTMFRGEIKEQKSYQSWSGTSRTARIKQHQTQRTYEIISMVYINAHRYWKTYSDVTCRLTDAATEVWKSSFFAREFCHSFDLTPTSFLHLTATKARMKMVCGTRSAFACMRCCSQTMPCGDGPNALCER